MHLPHFEGSFCYHLVSPLNGSFQRCSCGLFTAWKADGQAEGQTQCHLPGCHSYSLLASSPVFLVLLQALACIFWEFVPFRLYLENFRGMNPRLTTSAFMRSSEKRVADEFKRSLILAWAQPAFLVVLGGQAGLCPPEGLQRPKDYTGSLTAPIGPAPLQPLKAPWVKASEGACLVPLGPFRQEEEPLGSKRVPCPGPLKGKQARGPRSNHHCPNSLFSRASSKELIDMFSFFRKRN